MTNATEYNNDVLSDAPYVTKITIQGSYSYFGISNEEIRKALNLLKQAGYFSFPEEHNEPVVKRLTKILKGSWKVIADKGDKDLLHLYRLSYIPAKNEVLKEHNRLLELSEEFSELTLNVYRHNVEKFNIDKIQYTAGSSIEYQCGINFYPITNQDKP